MPNKVQLTNSQMFNINFGYLGIQLAWALQFANISGVFKFLGASEHQIPLLWLAGPITGLLIPPVIGFISDYTWVKFLGRRRFYIAIGSILAVVALIAIPHTRSLTQVVLLVWLLDSGLNMAMHPYRALIADKTPIHQQTKCFSVLTIASSVGSAVAFITPWVLSFFYFESYDVNTHSIPPTIETAFTMGAVLLLLTNLWTVLSTRESMTIIKTRPNLLKSSTIQTKVSVFNMGTIRQKLAEYLTMPEVMKNLIKVEFFTWIGMFSFIVYYALGISQNIYGLPESVSMAEHPEYSRLLQQGVELCGLHSFLYIIVSTVFALFLPKISPLIDRKNIYASCLFLGGLGLTLMKYCSTNQQLVPCVLLIGLAWGAATTIPFAILSSGVPNNKVGWYMGYYNLFVVIPQLIVSCCFGYIIKYHFNDNAMSIISFGGCFMLIGSYFAYKISDPYRIDTTNLSLEPKQL